MHLRESAAMAVGPSREEIAEEERLFKVANVVEDYMLERYKKEEPDSLHDLAEEICQDIRDCLVSWIDCCDSYREIQSEGMGRKERLLFELGCWVTRLAARIHFHDSNLLEYWELATQMFGIRATIAIHLREVKTRCLKSTQR